LVLSAFIQVRLQRVDERNFTQGAEEFFMDLKVEKVLHFQSSPEAGREDACGFWDRVG